MQIVELAAKLQSIGLTDKQARVYVAGLFMGPSSAQKISQQAGVNRATTYVILDELIEMGLVGQSSEAGKTVFVTEGVDAIERHIESLSRDLVTRQKELGKLASELKSVQNHGNSGTPQVFFFKGKEGVEQINRYYMKNSIPGSKSRVFSDRDQVRKIVPHAFQEHLENRLRKNIKALGIVHDSKETRVDDPKEIREVRQIQFKPAAEITIQNKFVMFATYNEKEHVSLVVESPEIAEAIAQLYDLAWQSLPQSKKKK